MNQKSTAGVHEFIEAVRLGKDRAHGPLSVVRISERRTGMVLSCCEGRLLWMIDKTFYGFAEGGLIRF